MSVIGVDLGGTNLSVGLISRSEVIKKISCRTDRTGATEILDQIAAQCLKLLKETGTDIIDLSGVGIASPGWVDARNGVICSSANLPLSQIPMAQKIHEKLKLPVRVENDANCAALGEYWYGIGRGYDNLLVLTVGTGFGAGVILNGRLLTGPGVAELGHTVLTLEGELCSCGRKGCCEAYLSGSGLMRMAGKAAYQNPQSRLCTGNITGESFFAAVAQQDQAALSVLDRYLFCFAEALMNFINIFRPEAVIIGGGISNAGDAFFIPLRERLAKVARANVYGIKTPEILKAALGDATGILGAAALLIQENEEN